MDNDELISRLTSAGVVRDPLYIEALRRVDRGLFVPYEFQRLAYRDRALPIGYGATISQPYTVAFMLELLQPHRGHKILDVGAGSGWTTALLASIVGSEGYVIGVEIVPELVAFGQSNLENFGTQNAHIESANVATLEGAGTFDRILVSAAARSIPESLIDKLKEGGILVMPVSSAIIRIQKDENGEVTTERHEGFAFVPLQ